jgi:hypothetical protein
MVRCISVETDKWFPRRATIAETALDLRETQESFTAALKMGSKYCLEEYIFLNILLPSIRNQELPGFSLSPLCPPESVLSVSNSLKLICIKKTSCRKNLKEVDFCFVTSSTKK